MDMLYTLMPLVLLIAIMYFLLIRPQKKREKQVNEMRSAVKVGDEVITIGGIHGTVSKVRDEYLTIQIGADKTKLEITRWAISKVVTDQPAMPRPTPRKKPVEEVEEDKPKKARPKKLEKPSHAPASDAAQNTAEKAAPAAEAAAQPATQAAESPAQETATEAAQQEASVKLEKAEKE